MGKEEKKEGERGLALKSPRKRGKRRAPCCREACLRGKTPGHRGLELVVGGDSVGPTV